LTILAGEKFTEREKILGPEKILGLEKTSRKEKILTTDNVWVNNSLSSSFAGFEVPNNKPSTKISTL
jgi:hypothetical protein